MKKQVTVCLAVGLMALAGAAFGAEKEQVPVAKGMASKAVSGAVNLVTGIVEWPMQTYKGYQNGLGFIKNKPTSKAVGGVVGFVWTGPGQTVSRMLWGGTELFGFWTANRPDNDKIGFPFDGKYSWEMGEKYDCFKPTLKEGLMPVPRKFVCGATDVFTGIVELPAQITKGAKEGRVGTGIVKGVWFWLSREWYGFSGILPGCLLSNSKNNPGHKMDGAWSWSGLSPDAELMDKK